MGLFNKQIKKTLIKRFKYTCEDCYVGGRYIPRHIITNVYEIRYKNIFTGNETKKYEISQHVPLIPDPFYDGEYSTNRRLNSSAIQAYADAQYYIDAELFNTDENEY